MSKSQISLSTTEIESKIVILDGFTQEIKSLAIGITKDKPLRQYLMSELLTEFEILINRTHVNLGYPYNEQQVLLTIEELCADMAIQYGFLRFTELKIAFKHGYKGEYGKFFGLNNATYFKWVQSYLKSEEMRQAKRIIEIAKKELARPPELTDKEKEEKTKKGIVICYQEHIKNSSPLIAPSVFYDYLQRRLIIDFPLAKREKFKLQAMREIIAEKNTQKAVNSFNVGQINNYIQTLTTNNLDVISRAKSIAIKSWFDQVHKDGKDINEILK